MRFVAQLNDAIRTLDVMGQIVKNFSGSLVGDVKFQLIDECYRLGLRIAGFVLDSWKEDPEKVINEMVDLILQAMKDDDQLKKVTRQELADLVRGLFFFLTEATTFGILKRIPHAVGAIKLFPTYHTLLAANPVTHFILPTISL